MKKWRKLSALVLTLVVGITLVATSGVALAGWSWCDDPIVSIGTPGSQPTTVQIEFFAQDTPWNLPTSVEITIPEGAVGTTVDPLGSTVTWKTDADLKITRDKIETVVKAFVPSDEAHKKFKVKVSANGRVLREAAGRTGDELELKVMVPRSR